jgi:D-alanyl-D-alanine carboxypeptidase
VRPAIRHLWLTLLVPATLLGQSLPSAARVRHVVDSLGDAFVASNSAPSVAIAVVRGNDTITLRAWGKADLENGVAATAASVYRLGSITKQFTAAAVLQLVDGGLVELDAPIRRYLPTVPAAWGAAQVRQLLNHTGGIPSYTDLGDPWYRRFGEAMTPDTLVALTGGQPLRFLPGTKWEYSNSGYVLLGMLVEKVSGHPWAEEIQTRFSGPLGLTDTQNCLTGPVIPRRVHGYQETPSGWENSVFLDMSQPYAAGALCSTLGDLVRWNRALHTGKVVSKASYAQMITPEGAAKSGALAYGFGLGRGRIGEWEMITHGGGIPGFATANAWIPAAELSITVLANAGGAPTDALLKAIAGAALGVAKP